jgi:dTDP-4-dehydrorhamnose reductase
MKILVTGANGQLGKELRDAARGFSSFQFTFTTRDELDIADAGAVDQYFSANSFDICINGAAYTAVDKAESELDNATLINTFSTEILAKATVKYGVKFIHISTDFVFDGRLPAPYQENDVTNPVNAYGRTKLQGEELCRQENAESVIVRTSWLYSSYGSNFVKTMRRLGQERESLKVIYDQVGTPTYARDLAKALLDIINNNGKNIQSGIYHYSNEGVASWYDFAAAIMQLSGLRCKVSPINTFEYPTPASRPAYCIMDKRKIKTTFGISIPYWRDSLAECIKELEKNAE